MQPLAATGPSDPILSILVPFKWMTLSWSIKPNRYKMYGPTVKWRGRWAAKLLQNYPWTEARDGTRRRVGIFFCLINHIFVPDLRCSEWNQSPIWMHYLLRSVYICYSLHVSAFKTQEIPRFFNLPRFERRNAGETSVKRVLKRV